MTLLTPAHRKLSVALAAALAILIATSSQAQQATAPAAAPAPAAPAAPETAEAAMPDEYIQELDDIMVRGSRLLDVISDKEDNFYDAFNRLNKDDRYDTSCVYLNVDPQSMATSIKSRVCIPGFVADAMADFAVWRARCQPPYEGRFDEFDCLDRNRDGRLSWQEASVRQELEEEFTTLDEDMDGKLDRPEFDMQSFGAPVVHQPPPPQLVLMEGTRKWYDHMMSVIRENPELQEMAGELDDLYRELAQMQDRFAELDTEQAAAQSSRRNSGPRVK